MTDVFSRSHWIFAETDGKPVVDRYFVYECPFTLNAPCAVSLRVSVYTDYALYINDKFVDCGAYPDYEGKPVYDTVDLSKAVLAGENRLKIVQYVCGADFHTSTAQIPGLIFEIIADGRVIAVSNEAVCSYEDTRYHACAEIVSPQLGFNFEYDAAGTVGLAHPSVLVEKSMNFRPRPIEKLVIGEQNSGKVTAQGVFFDADHTLPKSQRLMKAFLSMRKYTLWKTDGSARSYDVSEEPNIDGAYFVVDLGGETAGLLSFDIEVPASCEILIGYGEHLDDLRPRASVGNRNFAFRYIAASGRNRFFHPFRRLGGRYLIFLVYSKKAVIREAGIVPTDYPLTSREPVSNDRFWQHICAVGEKTLRLCMHEHYEDCPWREQSLYTMDSRVQILCGYYAFGETRFPRASLDLVSHRFFKDTDLLELCSPGGCPVTIPSFTAIYIREVLEYVQYSGDVTLARDVMPALRRVADGFASRIDETGLIPLYTCDGAWNFYEWRPQLDGYDPVPEGPLYEAPLCAFVADAFSCLAELLTITGEDGAAHYRALAASLGKAAHETFYDSTSGAYLTRRGDKEPRHQLTQALMLFAGLVPADNVPAIENALMNSSSLIPISVSMTIYGYEALLRNPNNRDYVLKDMERVWGAMLHAGADTFWETDAGADDFDMAGSLCHGWSAVPIYILGRYYND